MKKILFLGDVVGRPGRTFLAERLASLRRKYALELIVANGENAAGGAGLNARIAKELASVGVDGITLGDHTWDQKSFAREIGELEHVCRPANMADSCPGANSLVLEGNGWRLGVFTVLGRVFMGAGACPFLTADRMIKALKAETDAVLVEIHGEATSEKVALGWYLDGRAAAVIGTHTHIPTADARVLPGGTAYMTDAGMTGPYRSVLGREVEPVVAKFLDGMPRRFEVATGDVRICGAVIEIDESRGLARGIEPVMVRREAKR